MYCEKCKLNVRGSADTCPLCQGKLSGEKDEDVFPKIDTEIRERKYVKKIIALIMLISSVVCATVNYSTPQSGYWSLFVIAGFASFGLSFYFFLKKGDNIYKKILWQVLVLSIIAVIWDVSTSFRGWSTDFVIPIFSTAAMAAMAFISRIKRLKVEDFIIYLVIDAVFAIISLVLVATQITKIVLPSLICIGVSFISLGSVVIFEGSAVWTEIRRRMHL